MRGFLALASALWRYAGSKRPLVVLYTLMFVTANVIWLFEPYLIGKLLNELQMAAASGASSRDIMTYLALIVLLSGGFWVFHGPARYLERMIAFDIRVAFKEHLFSTVTSLPLQWQKTHHSGQTINRIGKATNSLFDFSQNGYQLIEMVVRPIGALVALTLILPMATVLTMGAMVFACVLVFFFDRVLLPLYVKVNEKEHRVASVLHDYITNIATVITLRLEKLTQSELLRRMTHYMPIYRREVRLNEVKWFLATMAISITTALVMGWYALSTIEVGGVLLAGTFFMLYDYLQKIGGAFYTFAWKYGQMIEQYADLKTVQPILEADRPELHDCSLPSEWNTVEIQHLNFTYKDEELRAHHLKDVSLTLKKGRKIAFIGESGSGKSTLMVLIRGLQTADSATVLCDGKKLVHGLKDVGCTVTLIPQEPEIFENTIEYNITLGTEHTEEEIIDDVKLARFESVIEKLPKGFQTNTAEKGVNLSGGEKQRLALARGFFAAKDSGIILLDEPTSSVDPANERHIYENLFKRFSDRCVVSSLHKLYLLPMFDEAYIFKDGAVVAHGTPQELLNEGGILHPLWKREREMVDLPSAS